jgi:hypothetical protein
MFHEEPCYLQTYLATCSASSLCLELQDPMFCSLKSKLHISLPGREASCRSSSELLSWSGISHFFPSLDWQFWDKLPQRVILVARQGWSPKKRNDFLPQLWALLIEIVDLRFFLAPADAKLIVCFSFWLAASALVILTTANLSDTGSYSLLVEFLTMLQRCHFFRSREFCALASGSPVKQHAAGTW